MRSRTRNCTGGETFPAKMAISSVILQFVFALEENRAAKTFFEITVQYLQVKMIRNLQTMKLLYHADK